MRFCWGNLSERDHLGDPGVDGRIRLIFRKWNGGGIDWIDLAHWLWRALVNAAMNLKTPVPG